MTAPVMDRRDMNRLAKEYAQNYTMIGLSCANCAQKIEDRATNIQGVAQASMQFATRTLRLMIEDKDLERIDGELQALIDEIEPGVIAQRVNKTAKKKSLSLDHSNCSTCSVDDHSHNHAGEGEDEDGHHHDHGGEVKKWFYIRMGLGAVLFVLGLVLELPTLWEIAIFAVSYLLIGGDIVWNAIKNIRRGEIFDENFLMSVASICAFAIGEFPEGVGVMLFYQVGEWFQGRAVRRSRKNIADLMDIRPDIAHIKRGDEWVDVDPSEVEMGDVILVRPGERIPLDGMIHNGNASLDTMALTGESVPRDVVSGDEVLSGMVNTNGLLEISVLRPYGESTASRILEMVENASHRKAKTERFITQFSRIYTPVVVAAAALLAIIPPLFFGGVWGDWLYRACVFLVVSCPCALVISIPLGFFGGIGAASSKGILVKGASTLEALLGVKAVAMDKTGTLTQGQFAVTAAVPAADVAQAQLTRLAAIAEGPSLHPIAQSIRRAYGDQGAPEQYEEIAGRGIRAMIDGEQVLAGNREWFLTMGIDCPDVSGTVVHIAQSGRYMGHLIIADQIRAESKAAIAALKASGVNRVAMLTGDTQAAAMKVAQELGIQEVHAGLLPGDKVGVVEDMLSSLGDKQRLAFVGDGINDAPVLARADVGVAMGALGSDAAIEAADVVLMNDDPGKLALAIRIARRTHRIVAENIILALAVKGIVLLLGALGMTTMWMAVFADVGVALLAVFNSMRVLRTRNV